MKKRLNASTGMKTAAERERLYIEAFIENGGNGRAAALTAGAKTEVAADQYHARLSRNVRVQQEIQRRREITLAEAQRRAGVSVEKVLREAARLSFFDIRKLYDGEGRLKKITELDDDTAAALASLEQEEISAGEVTLGTLRKVKTHDKNSALERLFKHLGLFKEDNAQKPPMLPPVITVVGVPGKARA